jgi:hypothetical protein
MKRTFFAELKINPERIKAVKFPAHSLEDAMQILHVYRMGAILGAVDIEVISLAAYKTRGREYEEL